MNILNQPYSLTKEQIDYYQKHQFIKLKNVLDAEAIEYFNMAITNKVDELNKETRLLKDRDTYGKAFLQLFNFWLESDEIKSLIFSKRLAQIATELMGVNGVRLYHDQALFKESGGGITPWHADQYYWPLSNDNTITAWIPLQETPLNMGPLEFSAGSFELVAGRELEIGDNSERILEDRLSESRFDHVIEAFDLGEVSFHSGWVFHRAGSNSSGETRKVMTIIYMDKEMKLKQPENEHQQSDWDKWCPGAKVGAEIDTKLNPVLYQNY